MQLPCGINNRLNKVVYELEEMHGEARQITSGPVKDQEAAELILTVGSSRLFIKFIYHTVGNKPSATNSSEERQMASNWLKTG